MTNNQCVGVVEFSENNFTASISHIKNKVLEVSVTKPWRVGMFGKADVFDSIHFYYTAVVGSATAVLAEL